MSTPMNPDEVDSLFDTAERLGKALAASQAREEELLRDNDRLIGALDSLERAGGDQGLSPEKRIDIIKENDDLRAREEELNVQLGAECRYEIEPKHWVLCPDHNALPEREEED